MFPIYNGPPPLHPDSHTLTTEKPTAANGVRVVWEKRESEVTEKFGKILLTIRNPLCFLFGERRRSALF